ncbi:MAG: AI-2E family transporter [Woeseia sp.]|nr:AI-2E family transporter [Woeseia sp.]NNE61228.1 AI-2E family transporter [Woeseia sp.]NNL54514.1 AI-2E family transporter [Woeseia sp.]
MKTKKKSEITGAAEGPFFRQFDASLATLGLFALATGAVLYFAANLLIPIAFAGLISLLLSPAVRYLTRWHIPTALASLLVIAMLVVTAAAALTNLAEPANQWLSEAPTSVRELQRKAFGPKEQLANIQELADEVEELTTSDSPDRPQPVVVTGPSVLETFVGGVPVLVANIGIVIFLTYFLLASGDQLLRRITQCGRNWSEQRRIVSISRQLQSDLSRYLVTVTLINMTLGLAVAVAMHLLEVPNPLMWGAMTALLNFAPYLGALASAAVLTFVGLTTFDSLADALMVPGVFLVLTILEGQLLTPSIVGRRMSLSPIFVFLSVVVWGWLWGVVGALMAVPIVTTLKVFCDHVPALEPVGRFLRHERSEPAVRVSRTASHSSA